MKNKYYKALMVACAISLSSCVEYAEEPDPCSTATSTVTINSSKKCFVDTNVNFQFENTPNAIGNLNLAHSQDSFDENLRLFFKIPQAGIELNTPYAITEGDYNSPESMTVTSGTVTLAVYNQDEISGTFQAVAESQNSTTASLTEGKFKYKL